jgi:uncharacterized iron-regulated membrane protein
MTLAAQRFCEHAVASVWVVTLLCGIILRAADLGGVERRIGGVLLGVSALSFALFALLLLDERRLAREGPDARRGAARRRCQRRHSRAAQPAAERSRLFAPIAVADCAEPGRRRPKAGQRYGAAARAAARTHIRTSGA